jgi:putative transposase
VEGGDLGRGKTTAAALGAWIVFEDESGQSMRPPRARTWARRGHTPVIRVRAGGKARVSIAGLACYRPGYRTRLICRLREYRGGKGARKAFTWPEYAALITSAHRRLPGGKIVLVWDNLNIHAQAEAGALNRQPWLRIYRLPPYAPDLNPLEGIWSVLKRGPLANLAITSFDHLLAVIQHRLRTIQRRPRLIDGCLAGTGLTLETTRTSSRQQELKVGKCSGVSGW